MIALLESHRVEVVEMLHLQELPPTWVCVRECMFGSVRIGMLPIRTAHSSCRFVVTSALALPNSFESIFRKGEIVNSKKLALLLLFVCPLMPHAQAEIKHIEMRVEGMT